MTPGAALLVDLLACYRLVRLVTEDHLTEALRDRIVTDAFTRAGLEVPDEPTAAGRVASAERLGVPKVPKLARLIVCPYCSGFWIACGVVLARKVAPRVWEPVALALALSAGAGLIAEQA